MMQCPKCGAPMQTFNRNGVQIEQCGGCRGIFLDYGELEALTRLEAQWAQPAPPPQHGGPQAYPSGPAWGAPHQGQHGQHGGYGYGGYGGQGHGHHGHKKGFGRMLFSS